MGRERRVVTLVADPFPPYQYMQGDEIAGLDYEIIRTALQTQGLDISVTLHPWDECVRHMEAGRADGAFQVAKTPEREQRFLFSDLLRVAKTVFYCHTAKPVALDTGDGLLGQLQKTTVAVVKGYSYDPEFDNLPGIPKLAVDSNQEVLLELSAKTVDLAILDEGVGVYLVDALRLRDTLQRIANFQIARPLFVAFDRARVDLHSAFNRGLEEIRQNGIYDQLMSKYDLQ